MVLYLELPIKLLKFKLFLFQNVSWVLSSPGYSVYLHARKARGSKPRKFDPNRESESSVQSGVGADYVKMIRFQKLDLRHDELLRWFLKLIPNLTDLKGGENLDSGLESGFKARRCMRMIFADYGRSSCVRLYFVLRRRGKKCVIIICWSWKNDLNDSSTPEEKIVGALDYFRNILKIIRDPCPLSGQWTDKSRIKRNFEQKKKFEYGWKISDWICPIWHIMTRGLVTDPLVNNALEARAAEWSKVILNGNFLSSKYFQKYDPHNVFPQKEKFPNYENNFTFFCLPLDPHQIQSKLSGKEICDPIPTQSISSRGNCWSERCPAECYV